MCLFPLILIIVPFIYVLNIQTLCHYFKTYPKASNVENTHRYQYYVDNESQNTDMLVGVVLVK